MFIHLGTRYSIDNLIIITKNSYLRRYMTDQPREKDLEDKIFTDENGVPYQGWRLVIITDPDEPYELIEIPVCYNNGKIHGKPGIKYPDGFEEYWENGKFMSIHKERDGLGGFSRSRISEIEPIRFM